MLIFRSYSTLIASRNLRKAQDSDSVIDFTKERINFERRALRLIYLAVEKGTSTGAFLSILKAGVWAVIVSPATSLLLPNILRLKL